MRYEKQFTTSRAIASKPYNTYTVKEQECVGCTLCKIVCPVDDCITIEVNRKGDEYLNWKEFQRRGLPLNDH